MTRIHFAILGARNPLPIAAMLLVLGCSRAQDTFSDGPLAQDCVAAWEQAGAQVGWMTITSGEYPEFHVHSEGLTDAVPAFRFPFRSETHISGLPVPTVRFGLDFSLTSVTDAKLKELARFKSLHTLNLDGSRISDAGLKELLHLQGLQRLGLAGPTLVTDAGLGALDDLSSLQTLCLTRSAVGDAGLEALSRAGTLQGLGLYRTQVSDAGIKYLARLTSLQRLDLDDTRVGDAGVRELANLEHLQLLSLADTQLTDTGLRDVGRMMTIRSLSIAHNQITDAGIRELTSLEQLQSLRLDFTQVTDTGLRELARLRNLRELSLAFTRATDAGMSDVARLTSLQTLKVSGPGVGDSGVKELTRLTLLKTLDIGGTRLTDAGIDAIPQFASLQALRVPFTQTSDVGLRKIVGIRRLKLLDLRGTEVTAAGVAEFQASAPTCRIEASFETTGLLREETGGRSARAATEGAGGVPRRSSVSAARTLEELHQLGDGPSVFTSSDWTILKRKLYADGLLGHVVVDGIYSYRSNPDKYVDVFRAMRDVFRNHGFMSPTADQIYNGAKLLGGGRLSTDDGVSIRNFGELAKQAGIPLMSREEYMSLDRR